MRPPARVCSRAVVAAVLALAATLATGPARSQVLLRALDAPSDEPGGFGGAVAGTGDLDGDGTPDLFVGAPYEDPGASPEDAGRAYALSGATGAVLHALAAPDEQLRGFFGYAVARVPDTDGVDDLLVGAPGPLVGNSDPSDRAHLFSGATGALLHTFVGPEPVPSGGDFGAAVAGVADVDGDGRGDVLVGAPSEGNLSEQRGRARLYSGATGALLVELASPEPDPGIGSDLGAAVAGAGDLDGDGVPDLLAGAPREDSEDGRAFAFSGATGAALHTFRPPPGESGLFGWSVAGVADADGDGVGDVVVGAPSASPGPSPPYAGRAYLFSGRTGARLRTLASPNEVPGAEGRFGHAVAGVNDLDGDGRGDVLVGAYGEVYGAGGGGRAYAFSGRTGALLFALGSPALAPGQFGVAVAGAGDVDGDGTGELLASGDGLVYVFSGVAPPALTVAAGPVDAVVEAGGRLRLLVTLASAAEVPLTGALRLVVQGPTDEQVSRLLLDEGTLSPGQTATPRFGVRVPEGAPVGEYTGVVVAESLSGVSVTSAPFAFEVTAGALAAGEGAGAEGWTAEVEAAGGLLLGGASEAVGSSSAVVGPNPAAERATLAVSLVTPSAVRLVVYDVLGREVAALDAGTLGAGAHRLALDVSAVPAGVYVWRLAAGTRTETGRLTVAR